MGQMSPLRTSQAHPRNKIAHQVFNANRPIFSIHRPKSGQKMRPLWRSWIAVITSSAPQWRISTTQGQGENSKESLSVGIQAFNSERGREGRCRALERGSTGSGISVSDFKHRSSSRHRATRISPQLQAWIWEYLTVHQQPRGNFRYLDSSQFLCSYSSFFVIVPFY